MTLLCAMNGNGTFSKPFNCIYPGELETKLEQSGEHACFLDLVIKIEDGLFAYKLFDKRDKFPSTIFCCSLYIQKYTETGAFFAQSIRTFFKDAITKGKSKLLQ